MRGRVDEEDIRLRSGTGVHEEADVLAFVCGEDRLVVDLQAHHGLREVDPAADDVDGVPDLEFATVDPDDRRVRLGEVMLDPADVLLDHGKRSVGEALQASATTVGRAAASLICRGPNLRALTPEKVLEVLGHGKAAKRPVGLDLSDAQLKDLLRQMMLLRTIDAKMLLLQRQGRVAFYGPVSGQEASIVGSGFALSKDDWIFSALREGPLALLRGMPIDAFLAENFGTSLSTQKARQMPCHYAWRGANVVAWSSVIATQIPHAVGAAMAMKYKGDKNVAVGYMGDGATSEGDFHVALNFAGVYKAPVVFVCQNNHWAISVPAKLQTASESFAMKADAYGFPGVRVDGNDVLAVFKVMREAIDRARRGDGPTLVECVTYRMGPHSSSDDPTKYRVDSEVEPWRKKDPIDRYKAFLTGIGLWSAAEDAKVQAELDAYVQKGIESAEGSPQPPPHWIVEDVYDEVTPRLERQFQEWDAANE